MTTIAEPQIRGGALLFGLLALGLSVLMVALDQFIVNVSISTISGELGVSQNDGTWSITVYAIANAISIPLTGWLTARFGWIRSLIGSVIGFTIFSFLCGAAWNFPVLILMRALQGIFGGPLMPLGQALFLYLLPRHKAISMGLMGLIIMVGPSCGPVLGGWITFNYGWRPIFYINLPIGVLAAFLLFFILRPIESVKKKQSLDYIGFILFTLSIGCYQVLIDKGFDYDWFHSYFIRTLGCISVVTFCLLVVWEWYHPQPLLALKQFLNPNFTCGSILVCCAMTVCFSNLVVGPIWVQAQLGYTPEWAGFTLAPLGISALLCFPLVGRFCNSIDSRIWVCASFGILYIAFWIQSLLEIHTPFHYIAISRVIMGIGFALFYVPLATIALGHVPNAQLADASALFAALRMIAIGTGVSLGTNYWLRVSNFFQSRYAELMIPSNPSFGFFLDALRDNLGIRGEKAYAFLYQLLVNQAMTESFLQLCYISGLILLPLLLLLCFIKNGACRKGKISK